MPRRAVTPGREAARGDGEKVAASLWRTNFFCQKLQFISKPSWGSPGGVWGVWKGVWGAVGLEKPVDSMTCKLFPSPIFLLRPVLTRSGMVQNQKKAHKIVRHPKKSKKPGIIDVSTPKMQFFWQKMTNPEMAMHGPDLV